MKIHILRCGEMSIPASMAGHGARALRWAADGALAAEKKRLRLPVFAYLAETARGRILIDTGFPRGVCPRGVPDVRAASAALSPALARYYRPLVPEGADIVSRLAGLGVEPSSLECVLVTHLDADHCGGLASLAGSPRVLISEEERYWSCRTVYSRRQPRALWECCAPEVFWYRGSPLGPRRWACDLYGDGSVLLVSTPGYTEGSFAVMLFEGGKYALFHSDLALDAGQLELCSPPAQVFDRAMAEKSLRWLREAASSPDCAAAFMNHDRSEARERVEF